MKHNLLTVCVLFTCPLLLLPTAQAVVTINGVVFESGHCTGIAHASIRLLPPKDSGNPVVVTVADGEGRFSAKLMTDGDYYVTVNDGTAQVFGRVLRVEAAKSLLISLTPVSGQSLPQAQCESLLNAIPRSNQSPLVLKGKGWQPSDLTSNPSSGIFVLDHNGGVSKLIPGQQGSSGIKKLFQLPGSYTGVALTATAESVLVASISQLGCTVYKYSLTSNAVSQRALVIHEACAGIATDGGTFYVSIPDRKEIRYWDSWDDHSYHSWSFDEPPGILVFDNIGHRLIAANTSGKAYAISVPDGKQQPLASNLGFVQSIAAARFHILVASGRKVLFLARSDNHGENPSSDLQSLTGGRIVGVAVDAADKLWFADYDNKLVEGPFSLDN